MFKKRNYLDEYILNSIAGSHMCRYDRVLIDAKQFSQSIFVADACEIPVVVKRNVELDADVDGECCSLFEAKHQTLPF